MNIQHSTPTTPLRARMISDMTARNLGPASQSSHLRACKRFAAWLGRSPETATLDDVKYFQQHLIESGAMLEYCKLDTYAIVRIFEEMERV
jgi:integrase/recombinase XerD